MEFPKTVAAVKRADKSQWAIGDALLAEIGPPRASASQSAKFSGCAAELAALGLRRYSVPYLMELRTIAHKFPAASRPNDLTTEVAMAAGTPQVLRQVERIAKSEGATMSKRYVRAKAKAVRHHDRKQRGLPVAPEPKSRANAGHSSRNEAPVSELRRTANVLEFDVICAKARALGREFMAKAAGFDFTDEERKDLREEVAEVLHTWSVAESAVVNPISREAEAFLKEIS